MKYKFKIQSKFLVKDKGYVKEIKKYIYKMISNGIYFSDELIDNLLDNG